MVRGELGQIAIHLFFALHGVDEFCRHVGEHLARVGEGERARGPPEGAGRQQDADREQRRDTRGEHASKDAASQLCAGREHVSLTAAPSGCCRRPST